MEHLVPKAEGELSSRAGIAGVILDIVPAAKPPAQFSRPPSLYKEESKVPDPCP